jgi:hypothetical protein
MRLFLSLEYKQKYCANRPTNSVPVPNKGWMIFFPKAGRVFGEICYFEKSIPLIFYL